MATYMQIDGIPGDVTAKGHENWISISEIHFGTRRNLSTDPGRIADREGTRPNISEITINKKVDQSSPLLFSESCVGKAKPTVKLDVCQTGSALSPYLQYTLNNAIVSGYQVSTGGEYPMESVCITFDKIEMKYTPYDEQNQPKSPIPAGYDLKTAAAV